MTDDRADAHYFDGDPVVDSDPVVVDVSLPDTALAIETDRGVFSRGRVDPGTDLLLRAGAALPSTGHGLDLGCGSGVLALVMARRAPDATVWAIDVNSRARELSRRNAERNGIGNVVVAAPGEVPADVRFDAIWSNPPIRIGKPALHDLLRTWIGRLSDDGQATLVVQKHLGADSLQTWLNGEGFATTRLQSKAGYRLLAVTAR